MNRLRHWFRNDTAEPVLVVRLGIEADSPWPVIREVMESVPVP